MNPAARLSVSLLVALLLWLPSLAATLRGELALPTAAGRYLLGFVLARLGIGLLARLVEGYAAAPGAAAADADEVRRRRSTDVATGDAA